MLIRDLLRRLPLRLDGKPVRACIIVIFTVLSALSGATCIRTVPEPAQSSIILSAAELHALPAFTGDFGFVRNGEPHPYNEAVYTGVALDTLLERYLRLASDASQVVVHAADGYSVELSLPQIRMDYPNGLKAILAYDKWGVALMDDEGPIRLIVPQSTPGPYELGGEINAPMCAKWVRTIEVRPVPPGTEVPAPESVPDGCIELYGSIGWPESATPATPPDEKPAIRVGRPAAAAQAAAASSIAGDGPDDAVLLSCGNIPWPARCPASPWPLVRFSFANAACLATGVRPQTGERGSA